MSEPRWNDAGTRPLPRDAQGTYTSQRTRNARAPADYRPPPPAVPTPRWGGLPFGRGIVLVAATTALGTVITVVAGRDPGFVLGFFLIIGAIAASFAVRPGAVYRIIPAPALAYLVGAIIAGIIHEGGTDTSRTAIALGAAQWIASGFLAMTAATVLVILIGVIRWGKHWYRSGAVGARVPASPRGASSLHNAGSRSTGSRSTGSPQGAPGLRSTANPRGTGNPRSTANPRGTGNPRSAGSASGSHSPAGPRSSTGGDDWRRSTPPGPGR
jgi:hypothetical protein